VGLDSVDVSAFELRCDDVFYIVWPSEGIVVPRVIVWCMDLGKPWQQ
jgi:hypothetical protein